jgi:hypothetical protein
MKKRMANGKWQMENQGGEAPLQRKALRPGKIIER